MSANGCDDELACEAGESRCADECCSNETPPSVAPASASSACQDKCCSDNAPTPTPALSAAPAASACGDKCCSSTAPTSTPAQSCRASTYPSCCLGLFCSAATAPVCCSPQVYHSALPVSPASAAAPLSASPASVSEWRRAALLVSLATVLWNVAEGALGVVYGAEDVSVALLGFGADSWVEVLSAAAVAHRFWRHETSRAQSTRKERRATLVIGSLLCLLAVSIAGGAVSALALHETPESSTASIAISSAAIGVMAALYFTKLHIAVELSSSALESDAQCSLCCIQLSSVLLVGSLVAHFAGDAVWWFDGATALLIALLVGREGVNAVRSARRPDFNGCGCCDENSGWYMQSLRKRRAATKSVLVPVI